MQTETMSVTGMTCGGCVSKVIQALTALPGVGHVDVSLPGKASVDFDEKLTSRERLQSAVKSAGFGVAAGGDPPASRNKGGAAADSADFLNCIALFDAVAGRRIDGATVRLTDVIALLQALPE